MNNKKGRKKWYSGAAVGIVAGICLCFITGINMVTGFAESMSNTPVIGEVVQYLTFNKVKDEKVMTTLFEENAELKISYPKIDGMKDKAVQDKINANIKKEMLSVVKRLAAEANVVEDSIEANIDDPNVITVEYKYVTGSNDKKYDHSYTITLSISTGEILSRQMK